MTDTKKKDSYVETIGRRKTSTARIRLQSAAKTSVVINGRPIEEYFTVALHRQYALAPLSINGTSGKYTITVVVSGGGVAGQAGAIRHGIARAILILDKNTKSDLSKAKMLTRDARAKERRKFGLKKARKAPQWSKR